MTEADAHSALQSALGMDHPLSKVDKCVISYLTNALADSSIAEKETVQTIAPFLSHFDCTLLGKQTEEIVTNIRRQLHGSTASPGSEREKLIRLSKKTRLGAGVGVALGGDSSENKKGRVKIAGNVNATLDRSAEAEKPKEVAAQRRGRRVGAQVKTYASQATVGSIKSKYIPGSTHIHIDGLELAFGGMTLLKNASLHVPYGKHIGVIG